jgi:ferredoxin
MIGYFAFYSQTQGTRATVKARTGQTLLDAAIMHKVDIMHPCNGGGGPRQVQRTDKWLEDTFGEGPMCFGCHVKIPSIYEKLLPQEFEDIRTDMQNYWAGEMSKTSRLACQIVLESKHDGMVVFVPDPPLTDMCP